MGLEIQRGKSKWWYGRVDVNGRRLNKNLGVEIQGTIPPKLSDLGDPVFERSRAKAQAALEKLQADMKRRGAAEELVQTLHEIRTGARVSSIALDDIAARWRAMPRKRPLSDRYLAQCESYLARFIAHVRRTSPSVQEMAHVQSAMARAFLKGEDERGVTAKTYNNELIFLRAVFHALRKDAGLAENPFDGIPTQDVETVFRKPFNADELKLIVEHAKADEFVYPLIITGICTAMRRGDCCTLLRKSVDLQSGFVTVKTSKTGEYVQIPIFPLLRGVLEKAMSEPSSGAPYYVFPALAAHYSTNPDHLTDRVRRIMGAAGFFDEKDARDGKVSRGELSQKRQRGLRRASLRDFHSFRVTWVTIALTAGVPLEIVQKVTGHRTAGIVMKHYFQPGREEFRRTLAGKMPALLSGPTTSEPITMAEICEALRGMTRDTWMDRRDELMRRIEERNRTRPNEESNRAA